jgi:hypothetical protein
VIRRRITDWAASLLAGLLVAAVIAWAGGPAWAGAGFGMLAFYVFRLGDKLDIWRR